MPNKFNNLFTEQKPSSLKKGSKFEGLFEGKNVKIVEQPQVFEPPRVAQLLPTTLQTLSELQLDPLSLRKDPKNALSRAWNSLNKSIAESSDNTAGRIRDYVENYGKRTLSENLGTELKVVSAIIPYPS